MLVPGPAMSQNDPSDCIPDHSDEAKEINCTWGVIGSPSGSLSFASAESTLTVHANGSGGTAVPAQMMSPGAIVQASGLAAGGWSVWKVTGALAVMRIGADWPTMIVHGLHGTSVPPAPAPASIWCTTM